MLTEKESGLYFESSGEFVTEREYIKEWCGEIVGDDDAFHDRNGFDYDLDDDAVYEDLLHHRHEQVEANRKDGFTIDLNTDDLQKSKVTLPRSNEKINFEDCDFDTTDAILSGLDIEYSSSAFELDIDELDIYENDRLISYINNGKTIIKTELTDTSFNVEEFIDYEVERFEGEVSISQIKDALASSELLEAQDQALEKLEDRLESVYGVKFDTMKLNENGTIVANFKVHKHNSEIKTCIDKNIGFYIHSGPSFEDVVDTADSSFKPSDDDLKSTLKSFVETKAKLEHKKLLEDETKLKQEKPSVSNKKRSSLRM